MSICNVQILAKLCNFRCTKIQGNNLYINLNLIYHKAYLLALTRTPLDSLSSSSTGCSSTIAHCAAANVSIEILNVTIRNYIVFSDQIGRSGSWRRWCSTTSTVSATTTSLTPGRWRRLVATRRVAAQQRSNMLHAISLIYRATINCCNDFSRCIARAIFLVSIACEYEYVEFSKIRFRKNVHQNLHIGWLKFFFHCRGQLIQHELMLVSILLNIWYEDSIIHSPDLNLQPKPHSFMRCQFTTTLMWCLLNEGFSKWNWRWC
jgi:hypothetical protein